MDEQDVEKMTDKYIEWKRKSNTLHEAYNTSGELLGFLEYEHVGAHMHWCWYQEQDIRMSPGCLEEIRCKQKELYRLVRNEK